MSLSPSIPAAEPHSMGVLMAGTLPAGIGDALACWANSRGAALVEVDPASWRPSDVRSQLPLLVVLGAGASDAGLCQLLRELKRDTRLLTVPAIVATPETAAAKWFAAGADEVLTAGLSGSDIEARLTAAHRRAWRDIQVNPSTRLAGSDAIADAIAERVERGEFFAACYADLDHFKEFNDRYGYAMGDGIIRSVAALLVDVVTAVAGERGFVGHIGGDDFLFLIPLDLVTETCEELVRRADEFLASRYSAHDRQAGYFFGKDRRGRLDRVPLMTLSIGVVTNERRRFTNAAQVSELATEMKTYAKTLPGSVWAVDRRSDGESEFPPEEKHQ